MSSNELEKLFSLFEKKLENLDRKVTEELVGITARLDSILDVGKAGPERPARQLNSKHSSKEKTTSKCYGCGEPGNLKLNCYKLKARIIRQEAGAQNGPPGSAHQARKNKCITGTVLIDIRKTLKAPQAFSGGPLIESGKDDFQVGNWAS